MWPTPAWSLAPLPGFVTVLCPTNGLSSFPGDWVCAPPAPAPMPDPSSPCPSPSHLLLFFLKNSLFENQSYRERERAPPSAGSFLKCPQRMGLGQAESRSQEPLLGRPPTRVSSIAFLGHKQAAGRRWSSRDLNQRPSHRAACRSDLSSRRTAQAAKQGRTPWCKGHLCSDGVRPERSWVDGTSKHCVLGGTHNEN